MITPGVRSCLKRVFVACRAYCEAVILDAIFCVGFVGASYVPRHAIGVHEIVQRRAEDIGFFLSEFLLLIGVAMCLGSLCFKVRPPNSLVCTTVVAFALGVMFFLLPPIITAGG
jgi:hypothetical protein